MRAIVYDFYTDIFPTDEEVMTLCRPGAGADTCVWLVLGSDGFQCTMNHKPFYLLERWMKGETSAKRNGCDRVAQFDPSGLSGAVEVPEV